MGEGDDDLVADGGVEVLLRQKVREYLDERREAGRPISMAHLDREIGRQGGGFVSKFLQGHRTARVVTTSLLLKILRAIEVHPAQFFAELMPPVGAKDIEAPHPLFGSARRLIRDSAAKHLAQVLHEKGVLSDREFAELLQKVEADS